MGLYGEGGSKKGLVNLDRECKGLEIISRWISTVKGQNNSCQNGFQLRFKFKYSDTLIDFES